MNGAVESGERAAKEIIQRIENPSIDTTILAASSIPPSEKDMANELRGFLSTTTLRPTTTTVLFVLSALILLMALLYQYLL